MPQDFTMWKMVFKYKTIFQGKQGKCWNSSKTFCLNLSFLSNGFKACQNPKSNLIKLEIIRQGFKMGKLVEEYKTNFLEKRGKRWNPSKTFSLYLSFL